MTDQWYYKLGEQVLGPISPTTLRQLAGAGIITPDTEVATSPDGDWVRAETIRGLFTSSPALQAATAEPKPKLADETLADAKLAGMQGTLVDEPLPFAKLLEEERTIVRPPVPRRGPREVLIQIEMRYPALRRLATVLRTFGLVCLIVAPLVAIYVGQMILRGVSSSESLYACGAAIFFLLWGAMTSFAVHHAGLVLLDVEEHVRATRLMTEQLQQQSEPVHLEDSHS